jgi:hypothetical protein
MKEQILTAIFSDEMRDDVIDALTAMERLSGFTMSRIDGFSREHSRYDVSEQVAGHRRMCRVEVLHSEALQQALLATLEAAGKASHLRYWITPLTASGTLGLG